MTHVEALDLDRLPKRLIVLGGGYIGLELSQAFRRFGLEVTVVHVGPQLAGPKILTSAPRSRICSSTRDSKSLSAPRFTASKDIQATAFECT